MSLFIVLIAVFALVAIAYGVGRWHSSRLWTKILDAAHAHWFDQLNYLIGATPVEMGPPNDDGRCPDCGEVHDDHEPQGGDDPEVN